MEILADYYKLDKSIKFGHHNYIPVYEKKFLTIKDSVNCLLEIGIGCVEKGDMIHMVKNGYKTGNSLRMWRDYFLNAEIHGLDINKEAMILNENRIITHTADQSNKEDIIRVANNVKRNIDIIIDDGSHNPEHQVKTFEYFHPYLKSNSIYCIEDIFSEYIPYFKNLQIFPKYFQEIIQNEYEFEFYDQRKFPEDNSVICMFTKKENKKEVYLSGIGGLGNCMFQIATAAYYSELFGFRIILDENSSNLHFGTSFMTDRDKRRKINNNPISYKYTIFNNTKLNYKNISNEMADVYFINNDFTSTKLIPEENINKIFISGYCQNYLLFNSILEKLPNYFNLNDDNYNIYLIEKYKINKDKINIMVGIRSCIDFQHMNKISKNSYTNAILNIIKNNPQLFRILIISDRIDNVNEKIEIIPNLEYVIIDEDDITQFYAGLMCSYFILSESTFHYWITLLKYATDKSIKVYVFNNTDLTNRNLALPEWIKIPY